MPLEEIEKVDIYTLGDVRRLFSPIPADEFCTGKVSDGNGRFCAIGHIKHRPYWRFTWDAIETVLERCGKSMYGLSEANEGRNGDPETSIKKRVLNYLS